LPVTNIFHPTDFSEASNVAFRHAMRMTLVTRGSLEILHVAPKGKAIGWSEYPHVRETLHKWGLLHEGFTIEDLTRKTGIKVRKSRAEGSNVVEATSQHIARHPVDMMVLSTEGRSGLAEIISPSVSTALAAAISRPTLFFREGVKGFVSPDGRLEGVNILIAVDDDPDPQLPFDYLPELSRLVGAQIRKVVSLHCGSALRNRPVAPASMDMTVFEHIDSDGDAVDTINAKAAEMQADIIIVTTAGPSSIRETLLGSTTRNIIRSAPCAVLSLPAPSYDAQPAV